MKTDLKNKYFKMRESGIIQDVKVQPLNAIVEKRSTLGTSIAGDFRASKQGQIEELNVVDENPTDVSMYRANGGPLDVSQVAALQDDDDLSTLSDRSDLSEGQLDLLREQRSNKVLTWDSLSFWDKAALFNKWSLFMAFGNLFTIFGSLFYILSPYFDLVQVELFIGLGCAVNWIAIARYFVRSAQYSIITRTLQVAVPLNIKIMAGIMPIFIGYCLLAITVFWNDREFFCDFSNTAYTFFAMMNGDSILITFANTTRKNPIIGQLMCYSFVFMAICVFQNMNLVVVEDSYLNVKYKTGYSWLTGENGDDGQPPNEE